MENKKIVHVKNAKIKFYVWALFFTALLSSTAVYANDVKESPFTFSGSDIQNICAKSPSVCEIWIDGVIEGIEFLKVASPSDNQNVMQKNAVFCFKDFSTDMKQIRIDLLESLSHEDESALEKQPALVNLIDALGKYRCAEK